MPKHSGRGFRVSSRELIYAIGHVFKLSETAKMILKVLVRTRQALSVTDIADRVRRSDRAVRTHLGNLVKKGILIRKVIVTKNKKLAYRYALGPLEKIFLALKSEVGRQLSKLEALEKRVKSKISAAKSGN